MEDDDSTKLLGEFRSLLAKLKLIDWRIWFDKITKNYEEEEKKLNSSEVKDGCNVRDFISMGQSDMDNIKTIVDKFSDIDDFSIRIVPNWTGTVKALTDYLNKLFSAQPSDLKAPLPKKFESFSSIDYLLELLFRISRRLEQVLSDARNYKAFRNDPVSDNEAEEALARYIRVGESIRSQEGYEKSNVGKLDDLLFRKNEALKKFINDSFYYPSNAFVTLACPWLDGKTQAAFIFDRVKTLYFPLRNTQPIYRNFQGLTKGLLECVAADFEKFGREDLCNQPGLRYRHFSSEFYTLGFLKTLIEQSTNPNNQPWMQFHAKRSGFSFRTVSIESLKDSKLFEGFALFLDEFVEDDAGIFVRDLARAVELTCLVVSTNVSRTSYNFIESTSSRVGACSIWSVVVPKLDGACTAVLDSEYGLNDIISKMKAARPDSDAVTRYLDDIKENQLNTLRPGFAIFVVNILKEISESNYNCTLGWLLEHLSLQLSLKLRQERPSIDGTYLGKLAQFALFRARAFASFRYPTYNVSDEDHWKKSEEKFYFFDDMEEADYDHLLHVTDEDFAFDIQTEIRLKNDRIFETLSEFSTDHIFYLKAEGKKNNGWFTLTLPPDSGNIVSIFGGQSYDWKYLLSEFQDDEFLALAASMFVPRSDSIANLLFDATDIQKTMEEESGSKISCLKDLKTIFLKDHSFGDTAALSIVDASHYSRDLAGVQSFTFKGQTGDSFIKNVIFNLILGRNAQKFVSSLEMSEALQILLESSRIPFLYALERQDSNFYALSNQDDIFVQSFERTLTSYNFDGKFTFLLNGSTQTFYGSCQHQFEAIMSGKALSILRKSIEKQSANVSFVFCLKFLQYTTEEELLSSYCEEKKINLYQVFRTETDSNSFEIIPVYEERDDALHTCIIFASQVINFVDRNLEDNTAQAPTKAEQSRKRQRSD